MDAGKVINVLSVDGGGRRGYVPAVVLAALEQRLGKRCHEIFRYVAGTSTGAILAAGVAHGLAAQDMVLMYEHDLPQIFARPFWHRVRTLWGLLGPKYPLTGLADVLAARLEGRLLGNAGTAVMMTSYSLRARSPRLFKSWREMDGAWSLENAALCSAAAPSYFPAFEGQYVDGGVFAPDPSMCLLADVCERHPGIPVRMLSLGTGTHEDALRDPGGLLGWATKVADVLLDGSEDSTAYQARRHPVFRLPGASFHRLQFWLSDPATRAMDGVIVPGLRVAAQKVVSSEGFEAAAKALGG